MDSFSRRTFLKFTFFTLADVFSLPVIVLGEEGRKPNVVIMFTDDQGTLDANCYGSKDLYTPTMDKLAETGVRFTQAYAHTVCCPARAPMLTGRHPQRCGVNTWMQEKMTGTDNKNNMFIEEITLAEVLKKETYRIILSKRIRNSMSVMQGSRSRVGRMPRLSLQLMTGWDGW